MAPKRREKSPGERLCAGYFRQRGWPAEFEKSVGTKKPDFTVSHCTGNFVVEVYEPNEKVDWAGAFARGPAALPSKLFRQKSKREQIAAAHAHSLPCLCVLAATNSLRIAPIGIATAMMGLRGYAGTASFNDVSAVAVVETFNPTAWKISATVDERLGSRGKEASLGGAVAVLDATRDLLASGSYDPGALAARLSILVNPFADYPVDESLFPGPHDEVWGRTGKAGPEWYGKVTDGDLIYEIGGSR